MVVLLVSLTKWAGDLATKIWMSLAKWAGDLATNISMAFSEELKLGGKVFVMNKDESTANQINGLRSI